MSMLYLLFSFEILHARWAMLGSIGAVLPELLDLLGAFHFAEPVWWRVGYSKLKASTLFPSKYINYFIYFAGELFSSM